MRIRLLFLFLASVLVVSVTIKTSAAYTVEGTVVNGTTGETGLDTDVTVVNPTGGMKEERTVRAAGGRFTVDGLDDAVPAYILRLDYKGVRYDYLVRPSGGDIVETTVYVYEHSASWDGVAVSVPRLTVSRHDDHLQLERVYEIDNKNDPPATIIGEDAYFKFVLPQDVQVFQTLFVSALGVPVEQTPVATGLPGVYRVEYPLRPGVTRIGYSYTVPYSNGHYALSENLLYDTEKIVITSDDPALNVTSGTGDLVEVNNPHGPRTFVVENLRRGERLNLVFTGGGGGREDRSGEPEISVVPNRTEPVSSRVMVVLLVALLLLFALAAREPKDTGEQKQLYQMTRDLLLDRLAKLDDLYDAGAVAAAAYYAKRAEMKNQAAAVLYRMGGAAAIGRGRKKRTGKPRK